MEHVVFFPAHDGSPAFRRLATLDEAILLVEHLRNVEGVAEVSVHALTEVPLAFKAYYRVEVPGATDSAEPAEAPVPAEPEPVEPPADAVTVAVEPSVPAQATAPVELAADLGQDVPALQPVLALNGGRPVDGPTSLGFFVS